MDNARHWKTWANLDQKRVRIFELEIVSPNPKRASERTCSCYEVIFPVEAAVSEAYARKKADMLKQSTRVLSSTLSQKVGVAFWGTTSELLKALVNERTM